MRAHASYTSMLPPLIGCPARSSSKRVGKREKREKREKEGGRASLAARMHLRTCGPVGCWAFGHLAVLGWWRPTPASWQNCGYPQFGQLAGVGRHQPRTARWPNDRQLPVDLTAGNDPLDQRPSTARWPVGGHRSVGPTDRHLAVGPTTVNGQLAKQWVATDGGRQRPVGPTAVNWQLDRRSVSARSAIGGYPPIGDRAVDGS